MLMASGTLLADETAVHFDRDIRPILSENCFACHGPGEQEAGLRLDSAEAATQKLESGLQAIVSGDPESSELIVRILSQDLDVVMPPPHSNKSLSQEEKERIRTWIAEGGVFEGHWSFQPIERPMIPEVSKDSITNPIDHFIESRIQAEAITMNEEADRATLLRRLSFALIGLPPTPAELDAFLNDSSVDAYGKQVERLLRSPRHGEEMARHWLDVARYADTHGLHLDNEREMWAYRDWVVTAFNENLPFDQFTIWQLAGDLLPSPTTPQKIATGFSRCNVTTSEGGSINEELLFRYAVDRTATMTNAFLGLSGQCAVCHDHKFDPISQKEFYSLYAFFNSAADPGFDGNKIDTPPVMPLPTTEQADQLKQLEDDHPGMVQAVSEEVSNASYTDPASLRPRPVPDRIEQVWLDDEFPPGAVMRSSGSQTISWLTGDENAGVLSGQRSLERTATGIGQDFYDSGAQSFELQADEEVFAHVWLDPSNPPKSIMIQFNTGAWSHRAVWGDPDAIPWGDRGKPSRYHVGDLPQQGTWERIAVSAEALGIKPGVAVKGFALTQFDGHVRWDMVGGVRESDPVTDPKRSFEAWWKAHVGKDKLDAIPGNLRKLVKAGPAETTTPKDVEAILTHWKKAVWSEKPAALLTAIKELDDNEKAKVELEKKIPKTFVFADLPKMRDSFVMQRGAYDRPGEKVTRATPAFLPKLHVANESVPTRLNLAEWIISPEQPLTSRVAVNRLWQQFFGVGLVKTSGDFGLQGAPPSHPELLDWLASEYQASDWNTRHMVRLIVTSRAFRRASHIVPEQLQHDPENRLYARGPRFRLDAEQIRDNALAVSGLLVLKQGGKGVNPYQPPNIWEPVGFSGSNTRNYKQGSGEDLYRRTMYTFLKRTAPHPSLVNFDAPNREQFCARRERSNTPLQALQLMNDIQHIEAARALAGRSLLEVQANDRERITWLFRVVLARPPSADEHKTVADFLERSRTRYATDLESAKKAIAHGESPVPAELSPVELASWTLVSNMMLNLDETVTRN